MFYRKSLLVFAFAALGLAFAERESGAWPWSSSGWSNGPVITCFDSPEPAELFIDCPGCPNPGTANGTFSGLTVNEGVGPDNNVAFCCVQNNQGVCTQNAAAFFEREVTFNGVSANCTSANGTGTCVYSLFYNPNATTPQVVGHATLLSSLNLQIPAEFGLPDPTKFGCQNLTSCTVNYGMVLGLKGNFFPKIEGLARDQLLSFTESQASPITAGNWRARFFRSDFNSPTVTTTLPQVVEGGGASGIIVADYRPNSNDTWTPTGNTNVTLVVFGNAQVDVTRIDPNSALINGADIVTGFTLAAGNTARVTFRENAIPFEGTCFDGQERFVEFKADLCTADVATVPDPASCPAAFRQEISGRDDVTVQTNQPAGLCSNMVNP